MDVYPGVVRIQFSQWLRPWERTETLAIQFGHLELGHPMMTYLDRIEDCCKSYLDRQAMKWAADRLVPDQIIERALRESWDIWQVADECHVSEIFVHLKASLWFSRQREYIFYDFA